MIAKLDNAHTLISYYQKIYAEKYGEKPVLNRNKLKYLIADALRDFKIADFKAVIEYYLEVEKDPSLLKLCYEYAEIWERLRRNKKDADTRKQLLRDTKSRVQQFRERFGK